MKRRNYIILFAIPLFLLIGLSKTVPIPISQSSGMNTFIISETAAHAPIIITSPDNFTQLGFLGSGSPEDPYRIEDLSIVSPDGNNCITVSGDFQDYYVINNCILENSTGPVPMSLAFGIYLGTGNASVTNCQFLNCDFGIEAIGSEVTVNHVMFTNCLGGLRSSDTTSINISNMVVSEGFGAIIENSESVTILDSSISQIDYGDSMRFTSCESVFINNVTASHNRLLGGIEFTNCGIIDLVNSDFNFTKIECEGVEDVTLRSNLLTNSYLLFKNISISGVLTESTLQNSSVVVSSVNSFETMILSGNVAHESSIAVDAAKTVIENNNFTTSDKSEDYGSVFVAPNGGIDTVISNNIITGGKYGIYVWADNASIVENDISLSDIGILIASNANVIRNNSIHDNDLGIYIDFGSENKIYYNKIYDNGVNAEDNGTNNQFDDGISLGNYWDDLTVGVQTYQIPGTANSTDRWPMRYISELTTSMNQFITMISVAGVVVIVMVCVIFWMKKRNT